MFKIYCGVSVIINNNYSLSKSIISRSTPIYNSTHVSHRELFVLEVLKCAILPLCIVQSLCNLDFQTEFRFYVLVIKSIFSKTQLLKPKVQFRILLVILAFVGVTTQCTHKSSRRFRYLFPRFCVEGRDKRITFRKNITEKKLRIVTIKEFL